MNYSQLVLVPQVCPTHSRLDNLTESVVYFSQLVVILAEHERVSMSDADNYMSRAFPYAVTGVIPATLSTTKGSKRSYKVLDGVGV